MISRRPWPGWSQAIVPSLRSKPRIHRWTGMDGERTLEGGEEVTDADGPGSNSGRWGVGDGLQALLGTPMAAYSGCGERDGGIGHGKMRSRTGLARVGGDVGGTGGRAPSGWEWNGSQPGQGATELGFPRPALWQMQGEAACRAGEPSGQGEDPSSEGLGGHDLLTQADAGPSSGPGYAPSPEPPARRRWRQNGRTACGSARRRT